MYRKLSTKFTILQFVQLTVIAEWFGIVVTKSVFLLLTMLHNKTLTFTISLIHALLNCFTCKRAQQLQLFGHQ